MTLEFVCNLCGAPGTFRREHFDNPELPSCAACGSNVRFRWLAHRLSRELFGRPLALADFPTDAAIHGLGLTDPASIAATLARRFTYRNTFLTAEPRFDIRGDPSPIGPLDFLIASEVFEHVEPPVARAFANAARLLKPSGVFLFTVPWVWEGDAATAIPDLYDWRLTADDTGYAILNRTPDGAVQSFGGMAFDGSPGPSLGRTREHFPALHDWHLEEGALVNTRADGAIERFHELVFHGGPGLALEMRLFTRQGIVDELRAAGFERIEFETRDYPEAGILFGQPWSRPAVARLAG